MNASMPISHYDTLAFANQYFIIYSIHSLMMMMFAFFNRGEGRKNFALYYLEHAFSSFPCFRIGGYRSRTGAAAGQLAFFF
jgi:sulfur relay (sulfurtransferase) DsrC/TusE family protein